MIPITPGPITTPALTWAATNGITLIPSHAYNVESANRSDREIDVANPHGRNHLRALDVANFRMIFDWYLVAQRVGAMTLQLHETGQSQVDGAWVGAANIFTREPIGREGPSALRAQITVNEDPPVDVAEGEEVEIAGRALARREARRGPVHQRGDVFLERAQD